MRKQIGRPIAQIMADVQKVAAGFPGIIGVEAVNHYTASFRRQGFTDASLVPWQPRKGNKDPGRAILVKTGKLRRAIRILRQTDTQLVVGVNPTEVPYAGGHNSGYSGTVTVRAHRRKDSRGNIGRGRNRTASGVGFVRAHQRRMRMIKRQFIGQSAVLDKRINDKWIAAMNQATK